MIKEEKAEDDLGDFKVTQVTGNKSLNLEDGLVKWSAGSKTCGSERQWAAPISPVIQFLFSMQTKVLNQFWLLPQTQKLFLFPFVNLSRAKVTKIG